MSERSEIQKYTPLNEIVLGMRAPVGVVVVIGCRLQRNGNMNLVVPRKRARDVSELQ